MSDGNSPRTQPKTQVQVQARPHFESELNPGQITTERNGKGFNNVPISHPDAPGSNENGATNSPSMPASPGKYSSLKSRLIGIAAIVVIIAAIFSLNSPSGGAKNDTPTAQQFAEMQASFDAMLQAGGITLERVAQDQRASALAQIPISDEQKKSLSAAITSGQTDLVWITVWDNMAEDGDVVALTSNNIRVVVPIMHGRARIALPRPADGNVFLEGVHDGGGGITVALFSGGTPLLVPPMTVGQTVAIPVK